MLNKEKTYHPYLDFLRVISAFSVIYIHSDAAGLFETVQHGIVRTLIYIFASVAVRMAVPVFFMISGALLLGKDESWEKILKVRVSRIVIVLISVNFVKYMVALIQDDILASFDMWYFIEAAFSRGFTLAYWFLYAYIGFLLMLPFLRSMVKHIGGKEIAVLISFAVITQFVIPYYQYVSKAMGLEYLSLYNNLYLGAITNEIIFYPIVGYYMHNKLDVNVLKIKHIIMCIIVFLGSIAATTVLMYHNGVRNGFTSNYISMCSSVTAITIFVVIRWVFEKVEFVKNNKGLIRFVKFAGPLTLGIYMIDPILLMFRNDIIARINIDLFVFSLIWCVCSMIFGGAITYLLKRIPLVKKYI